MNEKKTFWGWAGLFIGYSLIAGTVAVYVLGMVAALKWLWAAVAGGVQ